MCSESDNGVLRDHAHLQVREKDESVIVKDGLLHLNGQFPAFFNIKGVIELAGECFEFVAVIVSVVDCRAI